MERGAWILQRYHELFGLSAQMLAAAREGRWDDLPALEQRRAELVNELRQDSLQSLVPASASSQVAELIESIQKMDTEIYELVEAWKAELSDLLGSMKTERKLSDTYGA